MGPRTRTGMVMLAVLALTTVACNSGTTEPSTELTVTVKEFQFAPNTWTVPAGEQVSITITNDGTVTMNGCCSKRA